MGIKILQSFSAGDTVPPWLFECDPKGTDSVRPEMTFTIDCHIIEVAMGYVVIQDSEPNSPSYFQADKGYNATISAASRTIFAPQGYFVFLGPDDPGHGTGKTIPIGP